VKPTSLSSWAQLHANVQGTIIDFGLRGEIWWPGNYLDHLVDDTTLPNITPQMREEYYAETSQILDRRARTWLLPRLGLAHALGPALSLFASYNRLAQKPNPRYLYAKLESQSPSSYQLIGNPALDAEQTVAIEGGIKWLYHPDWGLTASVYQRDIRDYIAAVVVIPDEDHPEDYWYAYDNRDMAQARGIELTVDGRRGSTLRVNMSASIAEVRGEHSLPEDIFRGRTSRESGVLLQEINLDWDKPWRISSSLDCKFGPEDAPQILGLTLGTNWDLHVGFWAEAGKRYTPYRDSVDEDGDTHYIRAGEPNSKLGPYWQSLDFSCARHFPIGATRLSIILSVTNILNHRNVTLINPLTGVAYDRSDPVPTGDNFFETAPIGFELPIWDDPSGYENPIHWQFGLKWSW
jgi:outer membrane receptor protein involved in Fe transport